MRYFRVVVSVDTVKVKETLEPLKTVHFRALVDDDKWLYQVIKDKQSKPFNRTFFERGSSAVYHHAMEGGDVVFFRLDPDGSQRRDISISAI